MANNIKTIRLRAGLTQKELSGLTGIRQSKISEYEALRNLDNITLGTLRKISEVLNTTVNELVYALPATEGEKILDIVSEKYVNDKEEAEKGNIDAIINNRFL